MLGIISKNNKWSNENLNWYWPDLIKDYHVQTNTLNDNLENPSNFGDKYYINLIYLFLRLDALEEFLKNSHFILNFVDLF